MTKPADFLQSVWDKMTDAEKKEIYLTDLRTSSKAPPYLAGLLDGSDLEIDKKIVIAEKIINGTPLTLEEKEAIGLEIAD